MALLRNDNKEAVKSASDFSYAAPYAGDHIRLVGDSGSIVFFLMFVWYSQLMIIKRSSPIHFFWHASDLRWHISKIATSYTRFLVVVLGTYKQIHNQSNLVMSDVDEDNFD